MKIVELIQVPNHKRNLDWLKNSLNAAIELELATIPVYLCAWWSIKDPSSTASTVIRTILIEEMLHMGLVCNMLTTIGGTPEISTVLPTYPGSLPGGVRPQLKVYLAGLSKDYLSKVCMEIEAPELAPTGLYLGKAYPSIGAFYDAILNAFQQINPPMSGKNQMSGDIGPNQLYEIKTIADVEKAILEIKEQGEGTGNSPEAVDFGGELAHYYKFAEVYYERTLIQVDGKWDYTGQAIDFPDTYPMGEVPSGGWPNPSPEVLGHLKDFNTIFKSVLHHLQSAWVKGDVNEFNTGIGKMFYLKGIVTKLLQTPLPDGSGKTYGPDFLLSA
ncbi:ferritin-like protein [Microcoleus sp. AT3-D2]|uniref:ferritin-like protein n=1 Tax=Microcoleus sp. AT3-D2 TaxID=2818612 RepID=UPI002FD15C44